LEEICDNRELVLVSVLRDALVQSLPVKVGYNSENMLIDSVEVRTRTDYEEWEIQEISGKIKMISVDEFGLGKGNLVNPNLATIILSSGSNVKLFLNLQRAERETKLAQLSLLQQAFRDKSDLTTVDDSDSTNSDHVRIVYQDNGASQSYVFISSTTGDGHVYRHDDDDIGTFADVERVSKPNAFVKLLGVDASLKSISTDYGAICDYAIADVEYPQFIGINCVDKTTTGDLDAGTYFYKICIEDWDGELYTLSDPIVVQNTAGSTSHDMRIICHKDQLSDDTLYRVKYIHIFRAYSSLSNDELDPATDYKFLYKIDINSSGWVEDSDHDIYYFDYTDNTTEDTISSVTFLESSGIGDTVKPRYVNGKYFTWIDNKLHLGNFSHDGDTYINRVARSADDQPDAIAFYDYYDFDIGDGEGINGMSQLYGRSIVFKKRKMGVFYEGRWEKTFIPGAHNSQAIFKVNDLLYFVSLDGIHVFDGAKIRNIHYPVIDYFDVINKDTYPPNVFFVDGKDRVYFILRGGGVCVYNVKWNTWTWYDDEMAFYGCFKNYAGQYIGWNDKRFYVFEDGTSVNDKEDYGGGNGTAISIAYESPLLRLGGAEGELAIPVSHRHRYKKDQAVSNTNKVTFTFYEYQDDVTGKTIRKTEDLEYHVGTTAAVKSYFFGPIMGESFSCRIAGTEIDGGNFEHHGFTIEYEIGGYWRGR